MLEAAFLEGLRAVFWPLYLLAIAAGAGAFVRGGSLALGRAVIGLMIVSVVQAAWEGVQSAPLSAWQQLLIDVPLLALITMPPRHYWQAALGALVFAQVVLHCIWALSPDLARMHWLGCLLLGFAKCLVLLLWSGGPRVETVLDRLSGLPARLVLAAGARLHA